MLNDAVTTTMQRKSSWLNYKIIVSACIVLTVRGDCACCVSACMHVVTRGSSAGIRLSTFFRVSYQQLQLTLPEMLAHPMY